MKKLVRQNISEDISIQQNEFFTQLFDRYYVRLSYYANTFIDDFDVCRDIVQEIYIKLWEKQLSNFLEEELEKFMYRSVKNACFDHIRKQKVRQNSREFILERLLEQEEIHIPEVEIMELANKIENIINELPEQTAHIFRLSRYENMSYPEIAEKLDLTVKGVEYHMSKALKSLQLQLKDYLPVIICFLGHFDKM